MASNDLQQGRLLFLFTYPRVASNLLVKILSIHDQPSVLTNGMGGYFFMPAFVAIAQAKLHDEHIDDWTEEEREKVKSLYQSGFDKMQTLINEARLENKILFVKEHANFMANPAKQSQYIWGRNSIYDVDWAPGLAQPSGFQHQYSPLNDSVLPDSLLHQIHPVFLIRHPALVFPSNFRVSMDKEAASDTRHERETMDITMTMRWTRRLYEFYTHGPTPASNDHHHQPVIIDAHDIITAPRQLLPQLCALTGLDYSKVSFTWQQASHETREGIVKANGPLAAKYLSTIWASEGIMQEKAMHAPEEIDISREAKAWREEFGEINARRLEAWVKEAMPDYNYLWERRLKPEPQMKEEKEGVTFDNRRSCFARMKSIVIRIRSYIRRIIIA
ncbi:MAG: hypothetical protein M1821_002655 [Bathelium mastoideum]|nr:MAG: hypothetical protein M1821_002655 [Bathelium mastoideum]